MDKLYKINQVVLVILFISMIMALNNSTLLVNTLGIIGIILSLLQCYMYIKIQKSNKPN